MNNLHVSLTNMRNESRVLKETRSIVEHGVAERIFIAALHDDGLEEYVEINDRIELRRFKLCSRRLPKVFFVQMFKYLEYCFRIIIHYRKCRMGMVNVHALGLLPMGVLLKRVLGAKLIYDTHELETEKNGDKGFGKVLSKLVECIFIKSCDLVIVVSDSIADWYSAEYKIDRPVVVMNAPRYRSPLKTNRLRAGLNISDDRKIFLYQGGLAPGRGIETIIEAFKRLNNKSVIVFMGYGELAPLVHEASSRYDNIYFHEAVPPDEVLEYTASADYGLSLMENSCLSYYYCMPNKLFEYIMACLPVIVSNMREMAAFVIENNVGVVAEDESREALIRAIEILLQRDSSELLARVNMTAEQYCWETQERIMIDAYRDLLNEGHVA